jgi:hypothetical protein
LRIELKKIIIFYGWDFLKEFGNVQKLFLLRTALEMVEIDFWLCHVKASPQDK